MFKRIEGIPLERRLIYWRSEHQLDTIRESSDGVASLLINDVQIEIDEAGRLHYVWGYCPHESWLAAPLKEPRGQTGCLAHHGSDVVPGISRRLNASRWSTTFDQSSGWLCVGEPRATGEAVAFAPGAVVVLSAGELVALWLKPEFC